MTYARLRQTLAEARGLTDADAIQTEIDGMLQPALTAVATDDECVGGFLPDDCELSDEMVAALAIHLDAIGETRNREIQRLRAARS